MVLLSADFRQVSCLTSETKFMGLPCDSDLPENVIVLFFGSWYTFPPSFMENSLVDFAQC